MILRGMPSFRSGDGRLDQLGVFCYDKRSRHRWIYKPNVALVSRLCLAGVAGFLRLYPMHIVYTAAFLIFLGLKVPKKVKLNSSGKTKLNDYPSWTILSMISCLWQKRL